jgi:hypothetical protein
MKKIAEHMPGYSYGAADVATSPVSMLDLESLKISAGFTEEGNSAEEVGKMHRAWCKSIQMQLALWVGPYTDSGQLEEW